MNWADRNLGELCSLITDGKHGDCKNEEGSGFFFISCKDVKDGRLHYDAARQIVRTDFAETHRRTDLKPGDVLLTNSGTIGRLAIAPDDDRTERTTFQKSVAVLKPIRELITPNFLYYKLAAENTRLINSAGGAAQKNLLLGELRRFSIRIPPLAMQCSITSILSAYDDLIENNRRRIQLLEQAARLLYKEWFVHLRFPGHEHTRTIDGVPEGWERQSLGEFATILKGKNITKETIEEGDVPVVAGGLKPAYYHNAANASGPVITVSASGANAGHVALYHQDVWASDCSYLSSSDNSEIWFLYLSMKYCQAEITGMQQGAAQPHVYPKHLKRLGLLLPPRNLLDLFKETVEVCFLQIANLEKQTEKLAKARDLLLPKLMNGEMVV